MREREKKRNIKKEIERERATNNNKNKIDTPIYSEVKRAKNRTKEIDKKNVINRKKVLYTYVHCRYINKCRFNLHNTTTKNDKKK